MALLGQGLYQMASTLHGSEAVQKAGERVRRSLQFSCPPAIFPCCEKESKPLLPRALWQADGETGRLLLDLRCGGRASGAVISIAALVFAYFCFWCRKAWLVLLRFGAAGTWTSAVRSLSQWMLFVQRTEKGFCTCQFSDHVYRLTSNSCCKEVFMESRCKLTCPASITSQAKSLLHEEAVS